MKKIFTILKMSLGLGLLVLLYYKIGLSKIINVISNMNILILPAILIILFFTFLIATLNIKLLTKALNYNISFRKLFKFYLLSWSTGLIIPGKLGEFSLAFLLRNEGITLGKGLSIALIDKLITVLTLAVISILGLLFIFNLQQTAIIVAIIILAMAVLVLLFSSGSVRQFIRKYILRKYENRFEGFSKTCFSLIRNKVIILNTGLTILKWAVASTTLWLFFFSLGTEISIVPIFFINAIATIVSLIPITISGLGIREGTAIYLYSMIGIHPTIVAGVYLLFVSLNYIIGSSVFFLVRINKDKKIIRV